MRSSQLDKKTGAEWLEKWSNINEELTRFSELLDIPASERPEEFRDSMQLAISASVVSAEVGSFPELLDLAIAEVMQTRQSKADTMLGEALGKLVSQDRVKKLIESAYDNAETISFTFDYSKSEIVSLAVNRVNRVSSTKAATTTNPGNAVGKRGRASSLGNMPEIDSPLHATNIKEIGSGVKLEVNGKILTGKEFVTEFAPDDVQNHTQYLPQESGGKGVRYSPQFVARTAQALIDSGTPVTIYS